MKKPHHLHWVWGPCMYAFHFLSYHVCGKVAAHYKVAHCPGAVVVSLSHWHLHFYVVLCLPTPHFINTIRMRVMRTMGFVERCPAGEPGRVNAL